MCPIYPIENRETGERKEVSLTLSDWEKFQEENPHWFRYYTPENVPGSGNVGDPRSKLLKTHPGWGEVMRKVKKAAPTNSSITSQY